MKPPNPITDDDSDKHSVVEQKQTQKRDSSAKRDMFYTRTSKIRRRVKSKWAEMREKVEVELAASLDDIAAADVKNLRRNLLNLMKRGGGAETESCDSDCHR